MVVPGVPKFQIPIPAEGESGPPRVGMVSPGFPNSRFQFQPRAKVDLRPKAPGAGTGTRNPESSVFINSVIDTVPYVSSVRMHAWRCEWYRYVGVNDSRARYLYRISWGLDICWGYTPSWYSYQGVPLLKHSISRNLNWPLIICHH